MSGTPFGLLCSARSRSSCQDLWTSSSEWLRFRLRIFRCALCNIEPHEHWSNRLSPSRAYRIDQTTLHIGMDLRCQRNYRYNTVLQLLSGRWQERCQLIEWRFSSLVDWCIARILQNLDCSSILISAKLGGVIFLVGRFQPQIIVFLICLWFRTYRWWILKTLRYVRCIECH